MSIRIPPAGANIEEIDYKIKRNVGREINTHFRTLNEHVNERHQLKNHEVEKVAMVALRLCNNLPGEEALHEYGRKGMRVRDLVEALDSMRFESPQKFLRMPELLRIIEEPCLSTHIYAGETLHLKCIATGFPYPVYTWFKMDREIGQNQDGKLLIRSARADHSGKYMCRVHNSEKKQVLWSRGGNAWCEVSITTKPVQHSLIEESEMIDKPQILVEPVNTDVGQGGEAIFKVEASARGRVYYQWYQDGTPMRENGTMQELRIEAAYPPGYTCIIQCKVYTKDSRGNEQCHLLSRQVKLTIKHENNLLTATDKIALVIGVSTTFSGESDLPEVESDLQKAHQLFKNLGFKVISLLNPTLKAMKIAVRKFVKLMDKGIYVTIYYAGHGCLFNGQHYLVPWDIRTSCPLEDCYCMEEIISDIQRDDRTYPGALWCFYDACRSIGKQFDDPRNFKSFIARPRGNEIFFFASGPAELAFARTNDPNVGGLFTAFLIETMNNVRPQRVTEIFETIKNKFLVGIDKKHQQNPELRLLHSNIDRISLLDPIRSHKVIDMDDKREEFFSTIQGLPDPKDFTVKSVNFTFKVFFSELLSNVLAMQVSVGQMGLAEKLKFELVIEDKIKRDVSTFEGVLIKPSVVTCQHQAPTYRWQFHRLERQTVPLRIALLLTITTANSSPMTCSTPLDLGRPLLGAAGFPAEEGTLRLGPSEPRENADQCTSYTSEA